MTRSTVLACSVLAALLLHALPSGAQSLPPQLQTDNARRQGGGGGGIPQLQTDTERSQALDDFNLAQSAQAGPPGGYPQPGGGYPQQQGGYPQQDDNGSPGRALGNAAAADALDLGSRYANSRIVVGGPNQPLQVGSDGIIRPAQNDDEK